MASKFAKVLDSMEKRKPEDARRQAKVDEKKKEIEERGSKDLALRWRRLRKEIEAHDEIGSRLNLDLEATFQMMVVAFEEEGLTKLNFTEDHGGGAVGTEPRIFVALRDEEVFDRMIAAGSSYDDARDAAREAALPKLREWAVGHGYENDLTINPQRLGSIFKDMLLEGVEIPPFVRFSSDTAAKLYK